MKIEFVTDSLHPGGAERVMSIIANSLAAKGYDMEIFCFSGKESFYPLNGVKAFFAEKEKPGVSMLQKALLLRNHTKKEKPDVVIAFMTGVYCLTLASLIGTGFKVITSERIDPRKGRRKWLRHIFLPLTDYHVVQTEEIKSYFSKSIQKRCSIIVNPVVEKAFEEKEPIKKKRFINVARYSEQKDHKMLIDAFAIAHAKHPDYTLSIYGEGPMEQELKDYINSKGLEGAAFIEGTSTEIIDEMRNSFAFCLSSLFEGMSNAMIEAVCVGIPVITTKVSGVQEIIKEDENGCVVPIHDRDSFAAAMLKLIGNQELVEKISKNNKAKGKELFSTEAVTEKWIEVINKVVRKYI